MRGTYSSMTLYVVIVLTQLAQVTGSGTFMYKMTESQFNEATQFSLINTADERTMGNSAFQYVREPLGYADDTQVTFPQDGILRTRAHYDSIAVTGVVELKLHGTSFLDYSTVVMFNNCSYLSEGPIEVVKSVEAIYYTRVSIQIGGSCQLRCHDYSVSGLFNRTLGEYASQKDILERLQATVCQSYKPTFEIDMKGKPMKQRFGNLEVVVPIKIFDTSAEIINSHIIVAFEISTNESRNLSTPKVSLGQPAKISGESHGGQSSFEVWVHVSFFNDVIFHRHLFAFDGNMGISLSTLITYISDKDVQKLRALIPKINSIFPDSKLDVLINSLSAYSTISPNGYLWVELNVTGSVTATLNCNPNRTYTVFKFSSRMSVPIQIGYDHKTFGVKVVTFRTIIYTGNTSIFYQLISYEQNYVPEVETQNFLNGTTFGHYDPEVLRHRGNFTILETHIGKVADRFLGSLFYILPQLLADHHVLETKKRLHGLSIDHYIPKGHVLMDGKIYLENDFLVIGGWLATIRHRPKRIPYENVTWIGELGDLDNYYFSFIDETPENATVLPVQNCTGPVPRLTSAAGTLTLTLNMAIVITTCLIGRFLSRVVNRTI